MLSTPGFSREVRGELLRGLGPHGARSRLMARKYAAIKSSLFGDPGWRALSTAAQHLYIVLLAHPALSYAGVVDWRPNRICLLADGWSEVDIYYAAQELSLNGWIVIDEQSEEVLVRSFLRHDSAMDQPHLAISMIKAYDAIASGQIREAIIFELNRLHRDRPEKEYWEDPRMLTILAHPATDGKLLGRQFEARGVLSALPSAA